MSFPMYRPVKKLKGMVIKNIDSGEIKIGREVVQTTYSRYVAQQGQLTWENVEIKYPYLKSEKNCCKSMSLLNCMKHMIPA